MKFVALSFFLLMPIGAEARQTKPTLAAYLAAHPVPHGLAVGAELKTATGAGTALDHFGRKAVKIGGITAIVPVEMVRFDDSLKKAPDLFDGLRRDSKVLYLISTLTPQQWKAAAGKGIGAGDLTGEAQAVFLSLLPKPMKWTKHRVDATRRPGEKTGEGALSLEDSARVRLKIEPRLRFLIPLADRQGSYTMREPDDEAGQPGEEVIRRDDAGEQNPSETFGVAVREVVPNVLKKGQLDTEGLTATIEVPAKVTVGGLLARIGSATGREILADARVRDLSVSFPEGKGRAGDLLDALALAVTGTFRKLGPAYLLVADVNGAGARKLRLAMWQDEIEQAVRAQEELWRESLTKSGLLSNVRLDAKDPLQSTEEVQNRLIRHPGQEQPFFSPDELNQGQRGFLNRFLASDQEGRYSRDKVGIESNVKYRFVLPNGQALPSEGYLGPDWLYRTNPDQRPMRPDPEVPLATNEEAANRPLAVTLNSLPEAKAAAETARAFGFTELWVQTDRKEILAAAVKEGMPVRLYTRPWTIGGTRPDSDRTLLGEGGRTVVGRMNTSSGWAALVRMIRMQSWPRLGPVTFDGDVLSPVDPHWRTVHSRLADLAGVPGIAGVVLNDSLIHGYEPVEDTVTYAMYNRAQSEMWAFGYDERARLAFFRAKGFDPIDLTSERLRLPIDVFTPFFSRYPRDGVKSVDGAYADWRNFLALANTTALRALRAEFPGLPVRVDVRRTTMSQIPLHAYVLREWASDAEMPAYRGAYILNLEASDIWLVAAPGPRSIEALADFSKAARVFAQRKTPLAVDITRIPASQWSEILSRSFTRKQPAIRTTE